MNALYKAELRASWRAWLSVCLPFIATGFGIGIAGLLIISAGQARVMGRLDEMSHGAYIYLGIVNILLTALVGLGVMSSAAELVVESRRGSIARLVLAGATPGQIRATLTSQLVVVAGLASLAGFLLAVILQPAIYNWVETLGDGMSPGTLRVSFSFPLLLGTVAGVIMVAVLAGIPVALRATRIPPVEALRQASAEPAHRIRKRDVIGFVLFTVVLIGLGAGSLTAMRGMDLQKGDFIMGTAMAILIISGLALQRGAPFLMRPVTRAWTALVRTRNPSWQLAWHTVLARSPRMIRTVVPVMFAVGILIGMLVVGTGANTMMEMMYGEGEAASGTDLGTMMILLGLAFLISLSGAVGNLLMMSRQRDAELALAGLSGATEPQQRWIVGFEGMIIAGTATLLGLVMAVLTSLYLNAAFLVFYDTSAWAISWVEAVIVIVGVLVLCVATTVLPSLPTLRQPPQKVVARLIAD